MRSLARLTSVSLLSVAAFSQSGEPAAKFEVAGVRVSAQTNSPFPFMRGPFLRGGRYEIRFATMVDLIRTAYNVDADKVIGGPSWLEMDRFDVTAKAPPKTATDTMRTMLQALLADRFKLAVHTDSKPLSAYALIAGKHPTMKKSDGSGNTGCKFTPPSPPPPGTPPSLPVLLFTCRNMTMAAFADNIKTMPLSQQYLNGNSVVDKTGLEGAWDFDFKYSVRGPASMGDPISLPDAVEKQLGLKLEPIKVPMSVIVVDSVEKTPSADPAGVAEALQTTAPPTEFEVADIKPTNPDFKGMRLQVQPGGRVNLAGVNLRFLIQQIWNVGDEMLINAPNWLDADRYDIVAKAPAAAQQTDASPGASAVPNRQAGPPIDIETVFVMIQSLLKDRFKLVTHTEVRTMPAYTLLAVKPKMKKADPASRTRFAEGPPPDGKDPRNSNPALSRLVNVQNMTMAQFAAQLQRIAPGYIHSPVLDSTGLDGTYDFTLSFSPAGMMQAMGPAGGGGRGGRGGDGPAPASGPAGIAEASDPSGVITLPEAIERQLGLKLELQKRPVSILVIDHIDRTPTEN